jgi:hypothetical protein
MSVRGPQKPHRATRRDLGTRPAGALWERARVHRGAGSRGVQDVALGVVALLRDEARCGEMGLSEPKKAPQRLAAKPAQNQPLIHALVAWRSQCPCCRP